MVQLKLIIPNLKSLRAELATPGTVGIVTFGRVISQDRYRSKAAKNERIVSAHVSPKFGMFGTFNSQQP